MKKTIYIIVILALIIFGGFYYTTSKANATDFYQKVDNVKYDTVLSSNKPTVYYYYQDTCHFCESIKDQVEKFNDLSLKNKQFDLKLVNMKDNYNKAAWYDWDAHNKKYGEGTDPKLNPDYKYNPSSMHKVDDIKVTGTPTMIYVKDKKVVDYQVGKPTIKLLNNVLSDFGIEPSLDDSNYGKTPEEK